MPAPAAPAAPPKPAATPAAAPPAPARAAEPAMNRNDSPDSDWLQEAGADLEALDRETNQPRPPRPAQGPDRRPAKPETPPEDVQQPPAKPETQPDDVINPGDETPPPAATPPAEPGRPLKASELRKAYEETKKKVTELEPEVTRLRARVSELETAGPKDTEQTQARVKTLEERNQQLENFVRLKHYEQSQEFLDKYQKPYEQAWERCLRDINMLEVETSDGKGGYVTRKASDGDVTYLAQLATTNLGEYIKQSNAMFGDAADIVRKHVERINETYQSQTQALEQAQKRANELDTNVKTQTIEQQRVKQKLWEDNNNELSTKFPTYFAPIQGDDTGNKLLNAGFAFADLLFQTGALSPDKIALLPAKYRQELETKGKLSPESKVRVDAIIRNKAAGHDRLARALKAEKAAHEETRKKLAEYEDSEPPVGGTQTNRSTANGHWSDDPNAELEDLARKGPG